MDREGEDRQQLESDYCSRCKMKAADFECSACTPFVYFCSTCDGYVHAMSTKRNHTRQLIEKKQKTNVLNEDSLNDIRDKYTKKKNRTNLTSHLDYANVSLDKERDRELVNNTNTNLNNLNPSNANPSYSPVRLGGYIPSSNVFSSNAYNTNYEADSNDKINHLNQHNMNSLSNTHHRTLSNLNSSYDYRRAHGENYFNEITKLYDQEKEDLITKNKSLESYSENIKLSLSEQIRNLQLTLDETIKKNAVHMKMLQEGHSLEMRKVTMEKDEEIKFLRDRNREIERCNSELLSKVEHTVNDIHLMKSSFHDKIEHTDLEKKRLEHDMNELKAFYEKRINFLTDSFAEEKAKLVANSDRNLEKLNSGYRESKEKYLGLISNLESDYKDLVRTLKISEEKSSQNINLLKNEINTLKAENSRINSLNSGLKVDIRNLQENLENSKKECKFFIKETEKISKDYECLSKENEETKLKYDKLHTLTHGKFDSKKKPKV